MTISPNFDPNKKKDDINDLYVGPLPTVNLDPINPAASTSSEQSSSSVEKSTKEHQQDPGVIALMPPMITQMDMTLFLQTNFLSSGIGAVGTAAGASAAALGDTSNQAVTSLLNGWLNNIQQINEQKKAETTSPAALATNDFKQRLQSGDTSAAAAAPVMASLLILATLASTGVAGPQLAQATMNVTTNTIEGAVTAITSSIPSLNDMNAALGLIGALFATAAMYPAIMVTLVQGTGTKGIDAAFAKNFSDQVVRNVKDPGFNNFLMMSVIGKLPNASQITPQRGQQLISMIKLALLFNALALVTKVETGHLTAEELAGMITGKIQLPAGDPRLAVIDLIKQELGNLTNTIERRKLVESLLSYFGANPDVESLTDPAKSVASMFSDSNSELLTNQSV